MGLLRNLLSGRGLRPLARDDEYTLGENDSFIARPQSNDDANTLISPHQKKITSVFSDDYLGNISIINNGDHLLFDNGTAYDYLGAGETVTAEVNYTIRNAFGQWHGATITLTIEGANDAPDANDVAASITEDSTAISLAADFTDLDAGDTHSFSVDTTGTQGSVTNNGDGTFTFDPNGQFEYLAVGETVTDSFTYTVDDGNGGVSSAQATITITGENDAPVVSAVTGSADEDGPPANIAANFTDVDASDTHTLGFAGAVGAVTDNGDGTFAYDPNGQFEHLAAGETATDSFTYTVDDGNGGVSSNTATITITGQNDAATISGPNTGNVVEDDPSSASGALIIEDPDNGEATFLPSANQPDSTGHTIHNDIDGNPALFLMNTEYGQFGMNLQTGQWNFTLFTPNQNDAAVQALAGGETRTVGINIESADGTATETISITITGTNDGPVAVADNGTIDEDSAIAVDVLANDTDVDGDDNPSNFTLNSVNPQGGLGAASILNNQLVFNPGNDFQNLAAGESAQVVVDYTMSDDSGAQSASTATITVTGANDDPIVNAVSGATNEDGPAIALAADFSDVDTSDTHSFSVDTTGTIGAVTNNGDGTFGYDPDGQFENLAVGETATDSFTYTVNDGNGGVVSNTVTVNVTGENDAPTANAIAASVSEDAPGFLTADFTDIDANDTHSFNINATGTAGTVTNNGDGTFGYDPNGAFESLAVGETATDSFTYTVDDGNGGVSTAQAIITITGENDDPVAQDDMVANVTPTGIDTLDQRSAEFIYNYFGEYADQYSGQRVFSMNYAAQSFVSDGEWLDSISFQTGRTRGGDGLDFKVMVVDYTESSAYGYDYLHPQNILFESELISVTESGWVNTEVMTGGLHLTKGQDYAIVFDLVSGYDGIMGSGNLGATKGDVLDGKAYYNLIYYSGENRDYIWNSYGLFDPSDKSLDIMLRLDYGAEAPAIEDSVTIFEAADFLANDSDVDSNTTLTIASIVGGQSANGATVSVNGDGNIVYDPTNADTLQALKTGDVLSDSFVYVVSDGNGGTDTATVTFDMEGRDDTAAISGESTTTVTESSPVSATGTLVVIDPDAGDDRFKPALVAALTGAYGTFVFDEVTGKWSYTLDTANPDVDYLNIGDTLTDTLTVESLDGTASETITVTIEGENTPAAFGGTDTGSVTEDSVLVATGNLTITDPDAGGARFILPASLDGVYGSFTFDEETGEWSYTLDPVLSQALSGPAEATETLTIMSPDGVSHDIVVTLSGENDAPVAIDDDPLTFTEDVRWHNGFEYLTSWGFHGPSETSGRDFIGVVIKAARYSIDKVEMFMRTIDGSDPMNVRLVLAEYDLATDQIGTVLGSTDWQEISEWSTSFQLMSFDFDQLLTIEGRPYVIMVDTDQDPGDSGGLRIRGASHVDWPSQYGSWYTVWNDGAQGATIQDQFSGPGWQNDEATGIYTLGIRLYQDRFLVGEEQTITFNGNALYRNDITDDAVNVTAVSRTSLGVDIVDNGDGTFTYDGRHLAEVQALPSYALLEDSFTYTITDTAGQTATATATIVSRGVNDPTVFSGDLTGAITEGGTEVTGGRVFADDIDTGESGFAPPDAQALEGIFGDFTFDAATGDWTYILDTSDPDTIHGLYDGVIHTDTLYLKSNGGVSETIDVAITGSGAHVRGPITLDMERPHLDSGAHYSTTSTIVSLPGTEMDFRGDSGYIAIIHDRDGSDNQVLQSLDYLVMERAGPDGYFDVESLDLNAVFGYVDGLDFDPQAHVVISGFHDGTLSGYLAFDAQYGQDYALTLDDGFHNINHFRIVADDANDYYTWIGIDDVELVY